MNSPLLPLQPLAILAKDYDEASQFAREWNLSDRDFTYIHNRESILHLRRPTVIKLNNWQWRRDARELKRLLDTRNPHYINEDQIKECFGIGGLRTGGKTRTNLNFLKKIFDKISEQNITPIECTNCGNNFFIVAHPGDSWPRSLYYSNEDEEVHMLVKDEAWYKDFIEEPVPNDSCEWHE